MVEFESQQSLLIFRVGPYLFCVPAVEVTAIIQPPRLTSLPLTPHYVIGSFLFRGHVATGISLRKKLNIEADGGEEKLSQLIVTQIGNNTAAFAVDVVDDIIDAQSVTWSQSDKLFHVDVVERYALYESSILFYTHFSKLFEGKAIEQFSTLASELVDTAISNLAPQTNVTAPQSQASSDTELKLDQSAPIAEMGDEALPQPEAQASVEPVEPAIENSFAAETVAIEPLPVEDNYIEPDLAPLENEGNAKSNEPIAEVVATAGSIDPIAELASEPIAELTVDESPVIESHVTPNFVADVSQNSNVADIEPTFSPVVEESESVAQNPTPESVGSVDSIQARAIEVELPIERDEMPTAINAIPAVEDSETANIDVEEIGNHPVSEFVDDEDLSDFDDEEQALIASVEEVELETHETEITPTPISVPPTTSVHSKLVAVRLGESEAKQAMMNHANFDTMPQEVLEEAPTTSPAPVPQIRTKRVDAPHPPRNKLIAIAVGGLVVAAAGAYVWHSLSATQPDQISQSIGTSAPLNEAPQIHGKDIARTPDTTRVLEVQGEDFTMIVERPIEAIAPLPPKAPETTPVAGAAPVTSVSTARSTPATGETVHIVVRGDTLWAIASRYLGNPYLYPELAQVNHIKDPNWIFPNDIVRIIRSE